MKKKNILNQKGSSLILLVMVISVVMFTFQVTIAARQLKNAEQARDATAQEVRYQMLSFLDSTLGQEMTLRNSRYSINEALIRCLSGSPSPCDEREDYDMVLASPTPPLVFQGGAWPEMPAGVPLLAGGLNTNKLFYTPTGGRCPTVGLEEVNTLCPLQAIIQFRPICGGTATAPELSTPGGGPCTGPATGIDVTIGVGKHLAGRLVYHKRTNSGGDAKVYRFSALLLKN